MQPRGTALLQITPIALYEPRVKYAVTRDFPTSTARNFRLDNVYLGAARLGTSPVKQRCDQGKYTGVIHLMRALNLGKVVLTSKKAQATSHITVIMGYIMG